MYDGKRVYKKKTQKNVRSKNAVLLVILKSYAKLQIQLSYDERAVEMRLPTHECIIQMQTTHPESPGFMPP